MHHAVQLPLALHFGFASETKSFKTFVAGDVGEHRFDHGHTVGVDAFAVVAVDALFHPVGVWGVGFPFFDDERDLSAMTISCVGRAGVAHAVCFQMTGAALAERAFKEEFVIAVGVIGFIFKPHAFSCRAGALLFCLVEAELIGAEIFVVGFGFVLMPLAVFFLLVFELGITAAKLIVGDVAVDLLFFNILHVGFVRVAGVGGDYGMLIDVLFYAESLKPLVDIFQHGL